MKQREKVNQKNPKRASELWDNFEHLYTHVTGFPKGGGGHIEETMAAKFLNLMKTRNPQIQEAR